MHHHNNETVLRQEGEAVLPQHDIHTSAGTPHSSKTLPIDIKAICPITSVPIESLLLGSSKVLNDNGASVSHSPTRTSAAAATPSMSAPAALVLHHPLIDANEGQVGSFSSLSTVTEESSDGEEEEGVEVQLASKLSVRSSKLNSSVVSTFLEHDMNDNDKERDSDAHSRRGSRRRSSSNSSSCTSASSDVIGCGGLVMNSSSSAEWLQGRDPSFYPADPFLPWHFCWVDDGMIGGCSAPVKRYHWKALADANVGLVVNLTETPITPAKTNRSTSRVILTTTNESNHHEDNDGSDEQFYFDEASGLVLDKASHKPVAGNRKSPCSRCEYVHEIFDEDLFDGIDPEFGMHTLFLPVQDGNIPRLEQLDIFRKHAAKTISKGKKVIVHCQAGVGRTGTFLAVFLMEKYLCSAQDALDKLRHIRPQSLQYDRFDWQSTPFAFSPPGHYNRNYLQERFLEVYHTLRIAERDQQLQQSTSPKLSIMQRSVQQKNGLSMSLFSSLDTEDRWEIVFGDYSETDVLSSMVGRAIGQSLLIIVDLEIEDKLLFFKEHPHTLFDIQSQILPECYICERILSVGPFLTHRGMSQFPPTEASAAFGCPSLSSLNNSENIDPNEISFESSAGMTSAEVVQLFEELTLQTPLTLVSQGVTPFNSPATPVETLNLIKVTESPLTSVDI